MKLQKMNKPQCLIYSAAMILDIEAERLMSEIGHDGLDIWWSRFDDNRKYRGHHIQEIIDCFLRRRKALVPIDIIPASAPDGHPDLVCTEIYRHPDARFWEYILNRKAILIGRNMAGNGHAVAWDGSKIFDPIGTIYAIKDFEISEAWVVFDLI